MMSSFHVNCLILFLGQKKNWKSQGKLVLTEQAVTHPGLPWGLGVLEVPLSLFFLFLVVVQGLRMFPNQGLNLVPRSESLES